MIYDSRNDQRRVLLEVDCAVLVQNQDYKVEVNVLSGLMIQKRTAELEGH